MIETITPDEARVQLSGIVTRMVAAAIASPELDCLYVNMLATCMEACERLLYHNGIRHDIMSEEGWPLLFPNDSYHEDEHIMNLCGADYYQLYMRSCTKDHPSTP